MFRKTPSKSASVGQPTNEGGHARSGAKAHQTAPVATALILALCAISSAGCSLLRVQAFVESNTSWSGFFEGRSVDGTGNMTVDLGIRGQTKCVTAQKNTRSGFLTVSIDGGEKKTTFADFGVVSVCSN